MKEYGVYICSIIIELILQNGTKMAPSLVTVKVFISVIRSNWIGHQVKVLGTKPHLMDKEEKLLVGSRENGS